MSPTDLLEYLDDHVGERLRVVLASGDEVIIQNALRATVTGLVLRIQLYDEAGERVRPEARAISIPNITLIEPIRRPPEGRRPRRRQ